MNAPRAEATAEMAMASIALPWRLIGNPSKVVTTLKGSPGMLNRMAGTIW